MIILVVNLTKHLVDITVEDLAAALIKTGWFFPSQRADAIVAAQDILTIIRTAWEHR